MALSKLTSDLFVISSLSNQPNQTDGLSATQLKAKFDAASNEIKDYLNNVLTSEIDDALAAMSSGIPSGSQIGTTKIADNSITFAKLAKTPVGYEAVGTAAIRNNAVTNEKLAGGITEDKLVGNIPAEKIANGIMNYQLSGGITNDKLAGSISNDKLAGGITNDKLAGSISYDKLAGNIPMAKLNAMAVTTASFSCGTSETIVPVSGVTADSVIIVSPNMSGDNYSTWNNYGVRALSNGDGVVTFIANSPCEVSANLFIFN